MQRSTIDAVGKGSEVWACVAVLVVSTVVVRALVVKVVVVVVLAVQLSPKLVTVSTAKHHMYRHEHSEPSTLGEELMSKGSGS